MDKRVLMTLSVAIAGSAAAAPLAAQAKTVSFAAEQAGAEPKSFAPMVGSWVISKDGNKNVLFIDGRVWKRGQPAGGLADKARELYGGRNEEVIESIQAVPYFPIAR